MFAQIAMIGGALLHFLFAFGELLPWGLPGILKGVLGAHKDQFEKSGFKDLTVTIVHNAGIYNVIVGAGFLWMAFPNAIGPGLEGAALTSVRVFFCLAAILAGVFGGMTLSKKTLVQAVVGLIGLAAVLS